MPILAPPIRDLTPEEFDVIDKEVIGHAFASQNELGRFCDEKIYENDLAVRLKAMGRDISTQTPLVVTHGTFSKTYKLDLICDYAVYDTKTVSAFNGAHQAQVLNYAMLLDIRHIKLLNFRTARVQGKLCVNSLTEGRRHQYDIDTTKFKELSPCCHSLMTTFRDLINDWGAFLETQLYRDAIAHLLGGETKCMRRIELYRGEHFLGTHEIAMHSPSHFFVISSVTRDTNDYYRQLSRFLRLTRLTGLQWINMNHHKIDLVTLSR